MNEPDHDPMTPEQAERWCDEWEATAAAIERARALPPDVLGEFVQTLRDIRAWPEVS